MVTEGIRFVYNTITEMLQEHVVIPETKGRKTCILKIQIIAARRMHLKQCISIIFIMGFSIRMVYSQSFSQPNYALKSHETLEIDRIEITPSGTTISCSIENRIEGGQFCADKNIFIIYPDLTKVKLISSSGIPACPATYKFRAVGEKIDFTLTFPPLREGTQWIDLVEDCQDNCFSFYGITLDDGINKKVNEAISMAEDGKTTESIKLYKQLLGELKGMNHGMEGSLYSELIILLHRSGKNEEAREWFGNLVSSDAPGKEKFIRNLRSRGIKF